MKRATGIGGVFFKSKDPASLKSWYRTHLGIESIVFQWRQHDDPRRLGHTVWGVFKQETKYFASGSKPFMLNYRVEALEALLDTLRAENVQVVGEVETYSYGKFGWIMDPEGNKIELWEPVDEVYAKQYSEQAASEHVIGIGGFFFEAHNPEALKAWYQKHLGLEVDASGAKFRWRSTGPDGRELYTQWRAGDSAETAKDFHPSEKLFMINYVVRDLDALLISLRQADVEVVGEVEQHDHGRFAWMLDPEGNKIELWEPPEEPQ